LEQASGKQHPETIAKPEENRRNKNEIFASFSDAAANSWNKISLWIL